MCWQRVVAVIAIRCRFEVVTIVVKITALNLAFMLLLHVPVKLTGLQAKQMLAQWCIQFDAFK